MPTFIKRPTVIEAPGNLPMLIEEYVGRINSGTQPVSIARVMSPAGRVEPGKTLEFDEYVVVLLGALRVESKDGGVDVRTGQAVIVRHGIWIRYSTPEETEYMSICLPAFAPRMMHRERE